MKPPATISTGYFPADNLFLRGAPEIAAAHRKSDSAKNSFLTGHDLWVILALYLLLDPRNPQAPVRTKYRDLMNILTFARKASRENPDCPGAFSPKKYEIIRDSLHRLFTTQISFWYRETAAKTRSRGSDRQQSFLCEFNGHVLDSYTLGYADDVDPEFCPADAKKNLGTPERQIWKILGRKPTYIEFTLSPRLVQGLQKRGQYFTLVNRKLFELRSFLGGNFAAVKLLFWLLGQTDERPESGAAKLMLRLNLGGHDTARAAQSFAEAIRLLQDAQVIVGVQKIPYKHRAGTFLRFEKSPAYFFTKAVTKKENTTTAGGFPPTVGGESTYPGGNDGK